jgi:hypothetical protein
MKDDECDYCWPNQGDYYYIFRSAHEGNYVPLIQLIENAATLNTPDLRGLLVKILSGQMPRHGHRQKSTLKGSKHKRAIADRVGALTGEGWKEMAAIAKAVVLQARREDRSARVLVRLGRTLLERRLPCLIGHAIDDLSRFFFTE